jgi:flavin-dependent dehydrogenase
MFDVVVVGAGPGGSVAAKRCLESELKTVLLEKRKLPRDKVCSGINHGEEVKEAQSFPAPFIFQRETRNDMRWAHRR